MAAAHEFDVVLMDVEMPVMDGLEATKRIREKEHANGTEQPVTIIGLSGNARPASILLSFDMQYI
jgi:CheY-like chemotaxis protein